MTAVFNSHLPVFYGPFKNLVKYDFPSIDYCSTMEANVLIIASDTDEVIPYSMAIEFKEQLNQKAELITISGLSHNDLIDNNLVWTSISSFVEQ